MIQFFLPCEPPTATAQQKGARIVTPKGGRPFVSFYKKQTLKDAESLFKGLLTRHMLDKPLTGPLAVEVDWVFPWRASEKKSILAAFYLLPKDTKPDADNSNKLLLDCMTELGFWGDDSQIYDLRVRKFWGIEAGLKVRIIHGDGVPSFNKDEGLGFEMSPEQEIAAMREMIGKLKDELTKALSAAIK